MKRTSWLGVIALARVAWPAASTPHAACIATHDEHVGITWWLEPRDRDGRAVGPRIELGWGYDGVESCVLDHRDGRYLATWAFWDPYGMQPELRTAVVEGDLRIAQHGRYIGPYPDVEPVAVTSERDGWVIEYRLGPGGEIHQVRTDRDGRLVTH